jgi:hypothetical protein
MPLVDVRPAADTLRCAECRAMLVEVRERADDRVHQLLCPFCDNHLVYRQAAPPARQEPTAQPPAPLDPRD